MCGIILAAAKSPVSEFVLAAHKRQRHRGPDDEGIHFSTIGDCHLGMAHQRLSILDLSQNGKQPMVSSTGQHRIIFNGEIYNYEALIKEFGLQNLVSKTDTEVVVELIERLGIHEACKKFNGMWAIAVHDVAENKLYLSRDRLGKKPLYYWQDGNGIFVASELHSLLQHPVLAKNRRPDPVVAARFLAYGLQNIDDRSWIEGVKFLPAASIGIVDLNTPEKGVLDISSYWQPAKTEADTFTTSADSLVDELKWLVEDSVKLRLQADVPVGIALSGGLDSSVITAMSVANKNGKQDSIKLFSAVNPKSKEDESFFVDSMARHVGKDVQKFILNPTADHDLFETLKTCISHSDGPLSSFSSVLFYKLMESAKDIGIKVILTGQGADEAFCGYRKYPILEAKRRLKNRDFTGAFKFLSGFLLNGTLISEFKFNEAKRYLGLSSKSILGPVALSSLDAISLSTIDTLPDRQWADLSRYSVPYLCHYEDRMSMAFSREIRSPFLDYRLVEFGLRLPADLKMKNGWTKYALREAFKDQLPHEVCWRKDKKGFVNPQDEWLKNILSDTLLQFMSNPRAKVYEYGLVDRDAYLSMFKTYMAGKGNIWFRDVFAPFSLELWLDYLESASATI